MKDKISIIIPCYNEEKCIPYLVKELDKLFDSLKKVNFEVIMVNNFSEDKTLELIKELNKKDKKYKYISFFFYFGKDASMYAGLKESTGDYVVIMDADLQDPPSLIKDMYELIKDGKYDSVATYRKDRKKESFLRSVCANIFYKIFNAVSNCNMISGARDFRMMNRSMVDAVLSLSEKQRFTKGIFSWVGFNTKWISFSNHERVAGKTKLPFKSATSYAIRGFTSFSSFPLIISFYLGILFLLISACLLIYLIVINSININNILLIILVFGIGLVLISLGVIGKYLFEVLMETKNRPLYIIKEKSK